MSTVDASDVPVLIELDELIELRADPLERLTWWTCRLCGETASALRGPKALKVATDHLLAEHAAVLFR